MNDQMNDVEEMQRSIYFLMLLKYYYIENVVCVNELC